MTRPSLKSDRRPPVQVLGPGAVLFSDSALLTIHRLAVLAQRLSSAEGVHELREVREVHNAVRTALAWSESERKIARNAEAACAESDVVSEEIPTVEVARLL